jgi:23S rRNA U2552 (ribose-2'-O)-methylase RlmE/FtsJ
LFVYNIDMKQICTIRVPQETRSIIVSNPEWVPSATHTEEIKGYWSKQVMKLKYKMDLPLYQRNWHKFKEYVNKYERIYTTSHRFPNHNVALHSPLSRSYFKLWDIMTDFKLLIEEHTQHLVTAHLAEGPGGFIESVCNYRKMHTDPETVKNDTYYGITLLTHCNNDDIPNWKKTQHLVNTHPQIRIHTGEDNTGNLYHVENIHAFVKDVGRQSCGLVTGDGGLDYSHNYAKQEALSQRLVLAQIYTALLLVQPKKHFVCKIFDTQAQFTQELLWILSVCFDVVHIVKPFTSRAANSERYVVSCGFRECPPEIEQFLCNLLKQWKDSMFLKSIFSMKLPTPFTNAVYKYSEWHAKQQFICINNCYNMINTHQGMRSESSEMRFIRQRQKLFAQQWCKKYKIPYRK